MDNFDALRRYYEGYEEDRRLDRPHGKVEFLTTMRYLERYLLPGARILDIGAGTGRYSHALARRGYQVDAVELIQHNIDVFQCHTQPGENVTVVQGNALDLSAFPDDTYDVTLLMGPLYHLAEEQERLLALSEAVRVTRPSGKVFAAYCMGDAALLYYGFREGHLNEIVESCGIDPLLFDAFPKPWGLFNLCRTENMDALNSRLPVRLAHRFAAEGYSCHMRESVAAMSKEAFDEWMRYHLAVCERPGMLEISNHVIDVLEKADF
ncbi:MAG: methyltransferase domain-containing protein [Christensenellaceae bacterium]|nr:methyltransferase domain-containing protein [Christensenellaceae bacterium]